MTQEIIDALKDCVASIAGYRREMSMIDGSGGLPCDAEKRAMEVIIRHDTEPKGPNYMGLPIGLMLDRLRETHGSVELTSTTAKWKVQTPQIEVEGGTAFHATMTAYKCIKHLYDGKDEELRACFEKIRVMVQKGSIEPQKGE